VFDLAVTELSWVRIDYQARLQFGEAELTIETFFGGAARAGQPGRATQRGVAPCPGRNSTSTAPGLPCHELAVAPA
jgi:hypothetical protein